MNLTTYIEPSTSPTEPSGNNLQAVNGTVHFFNIQDLYA
jgi:hypothetical protein